MKGMQEWPSALGVLVVLLVDAPEDIRIVPLEHPDFVRCAVRRGIIMNDNLKWKRGPLNQKAFDGIIDVRLVIEGCADNGNQRPCSVAGLTGN